MPLRKTSQDVYSRYELHEAIEWIYSFLLVTQNDHFFVCPLRISVVCVRMFREDGCKDHGQGFGHGLCLFSHPSGFQGCELVGSLPWPELPHPLEVLRILKCV